LTPAKFVDPKYVNTPRDAKPTLPHGQHGEQVYEQQSCPRNPDGTANYFANCTTLVEYQDGNVSIDGIVLKREVLQGIDPRDIAQQIDETKNSAHPDELQDVSAYTAARLEKGWLCRPVGPVRLERPAAQPELHPAVRRRRASHLDRARLVPATVLAGESGHGVSRRTRIG
jgi:hypothetical protein